MDIAQAEHSFLVLIKYCNSAEFLYEAIIHSVLKTDNIRNSFVCGLVLFDCTDNMLLFLFVSLYTQLVELERDQGLTYIEKINKQQQRHLLCVNISFLGPVSLAKNCLCIYDLI